MADFYTKCGAFNEEHLNYKAVGYETFPMGDNFAQQRGKMITHCNGQDKEYWCVNYLFSFLIFIIIFIIPIIRLISGK
jgi:hypothetical protein